MVMRIESFGNKNNVLAFLRAQFIPTLATTNAQDHHSHPPSNLPNIGMFYLLERTGRSLGSTIY